MTELTLENVLQAYASGVFPMAQDRHADRLYWVDPDRRGVLPLDSLRVSRRLARTVRSGRFDIRIDSAFDGVVRRCAASAPERGETWINDEIIALYGDLHAAGHAHSVECWRDGSLAGGLYGVSIAGAFFGESMFSGERDSSKVALVHLVARLRSGGYRLLDTQFVTDHLTTMGVIEIARVDYHQRLAEALACAADFYSFSGDGDPPSVLQSSTQTS